MLSSAQYSGTKLDRTRLGACHVGDCKLWRLDTVAAVIQASVSLPLDLSAYTFHINVLFSNVNYIYVDKQSLIVDVSL